MTKHYALATLALLMASSVTIGQEDASKISIGKPAPDFEVTGIDGQQFKLSDKTGAGKNIAIMFSRAHW